MNDVPCSVDGCPNLAAKDGYCWGHYQRKRRGRQVTGPLAEYARTPWDAVRKAAIALADADTSEDAAYDKADERLRLAVYRYFQSLPFIRDLLGWVAAQEQFRRVAVKHLRVPAPLPKSFHRLRWTGLKVLKALAEALRG